MNEGSRFRLRNIRIGYKLLGGFLIVALIGGAIGWVGYSGLKSTKNESRRIDG
ncbi:MAG: hypothetical protein GY835_23615, partial [bacterium]|nr:hypothetical protein [bacterium]